MPQTFRDYHIYEVAVLVENYEDHGDSERANAGDIVAIRRESVSGIGTKENSNLIWLRIDGGDSSLMDTFANSNFEGAKRFDKRRYCIPIKRLMELKPGLDLNRINDPTDVYQPFMAVVEPETASDTWTGLNTSTVAWRGPGTFRVPITKQYTHIDRVVISGLPQGWQAQDLLSEWEDLARMIGNRPAEQQVGRVIIRNERRDRLTLGPLIHITDAADVLTHTTLDVTVTGLLQDTGKIITKDQPYDYEGLVFDKAKMEYL